MIIKVGLDSLAILFLDKEIEYRDHPPYARPIFEMTQDKMSYIQLKLRNKLDAGVHINFLMNHPEYMWTNCVLMLDVENTYDMTLHTDVLAAYEAYKVLT